MKSLLSISCLSLLAAVALSGCGAPSAPENSADVPTVAPTKTNEDERYRATNADDQQFAPDAKPETIAAYKKAMKEVHQQRPPLDMKVPDKTRVIMQTSRGPITLELDGKAAPLHVKSFLYLAGKGFYDGTVFHRRDDLTQDGKGFIVQGGDPLTKIAGTSELYGMGGPGYEIPREKNKLTHEKLVIAAARTQDPDSAGSQFYITQGAVPFLDTGYGYTVFGKVVGGKDVALKLAKGDKIQSVKIENASSKN